MQQTKKKSVVRLVVISDTHGCHEELTYRMPPGDVLIHCGDFSDKGSRSQAASFAEWISQLDQYEQRFVIDGNHDRTRSNVDDNDDESSFQTMEEFFTGIPVRLLRDEYVETRDGLRIYGASWNSASDPVFSPDHRPDVVLSHRNPCLPKECLFEQVGVNQLQGWRGDRDTSRMVLSHQIPLCLSGHAHRCRGMVVVPHQDCGKEHSCSYFVNAASLRSGNAIMPPVVIDFDMNLRKPIHIAIDG